MSKTIAISDKTHILIVEKQTELYKKYRVNVRIFDIADIILKNYIDKVEELLGLGGRESRNGKQDVGGVQDAGAEKKDSDDKIVGDIYTAELKEASG